MHRHIFPLLFIICCLSISGCIFQEPSIGEITSNPRNYDGRSVTLSGKVGGIRSDFRNIVDINGEMTVEQSNEYTLIDPSGGIQVRTNSTPKYWDTVRISGVVKYHIGSCPPGMPPPPGFREQTCIRESVIIDEVNRIPLSCEDLPPFPTTYSQDSYHIQLCPVDLTNCNITRGMNCSLNIQCEDGRSITRSAGGRMEVNYPPIRSKERYIVIDGNGVMGYGDFLLIESTCLKNMAMFY